MLGNDGVSVLGDESMRVNNCDLREAQSKRDKSKWNSVSKVSEGESIHSSIENRSKSYPDDREDNENLQRML